MARKTKESLMTRTGLTLGLAFSLALAPLGQTARAGRGGSTAMIEQAIRSGSEDSIIASVEQAETLACTSCADTVMKLVDHPSARVRDVAGWWLSKRGVRVQVLADMAARLKAQDPGAARNAADVIGGMRDHTMVPALGQYLQRPLDEESGQAAARALGNIGHPAGLDGLRVGMGSSLAGVRAASAEAVRSLRAPLGKRAITDAQPLLPLLADADAHVRRQAAMSLGFVLDAAAGPALAKAVTSDASPLVRKAAAWAIGEIGAAQRLDASAAEALRAGVNDADPLVRSVANAALGRLK